MEPLAIDMTICLINRTAVYHLANELLSLLPLDTPTRYWRFCIRYKPTFADSAWTNAVSKLIHKFSSRDFDHLGSIPWPRASKRRMLFVDPLFCAVTNLHSDDLIYVHDVGPITHPALYNPGASLAYDRAYRKIQRAAPRLVFVSEYTRKQYMKVYPASYASSDVVPLYYRPVIHNAESADKPRSPTILMVGGIEKRKNPLRAIEGFWKSGLAEKGYVLKIVGPIDSGAGDVKELIRGHSSVECLGFVDAKTLASLYAEAVALLFPSILEGFGLPALEGPRLGLLPVVSSGTVLEEVVGPAGVMVDPLSVDSIAAGLAVACNLSREERDCRIRSIQEYQKRFCVENFRSAWQNLMLDRPKALDSVNVC